MSFTLDILGWFGGEEKKEGTLLALKSSVYVQYW
jgi:hypothetical protein